MATLEAVRDAAAALSAVMYVGEGNGTAMRGLWCSLKSGPADHAGLMLRLRAALDALEGAKP